MGKPLTFDHLMSRKKPVTKTVTIAMDPDLADEYEAAKRARDIAAVRAGGSDDKERQVALWEAEEELAAVERRLHDEDAVAVFTFRSIGRAAYDAIVDAHPPTPAQRAKAKREGLGELAANLETFPPALVSACLVDPIISHDDMAKLWVNDNWNQAELGALLEGAASANGTRRTLDLGKDSRGTPPSEPS